ncbi:MAG: hypothetical protein C0478_08300 [Planctomyces sp.]|nr:hypothetical protein [Planctomyces sp.]
MLLLIFCCTAGFGSGTSHASDSQPSASEIAKEFDRVNLEYDASVPELLPSHPEAKGQLYSIDLISVEAYVDFKSSIAREMVEEIEAIRKTPHIRHYSHCRLVTFPGVRCRERRGHWARVDNGGTIHRRRLDEAEECHIWEFVGETYETKLTAIEMGKVRTELLISKSHLQGAPFRLHLEEGETEPRWSLFPGTDKTTAEQVLPDDKYVLLSRSTSSTKVDAIEKVTFRHRFVRVTAYEPVAP